MVNESVLSNIFLKAVLPCLEPLTVKDAKAAQIASGWSGSIRFSSGIRGPRCTVELKDAKAFVTPSALPRPDIGLFFPNALMLNNLFRGKGITIPLPYKGLLQIKGLMVFSKLAARMQEILEGRERSVQDLKAELMIGLMSRAIVVLSEHDPEYKGHAAKLHGVAEFRIRNGFASHVDFSGTTPEARLGAASSPDFALEFADNALFLDVTEDKVDVQAQACLGGISLQGDLHMGQIINIALDKIGEYLL